MFGGISRDCNISHSGHMLYPHMESEKGETTTRGQQKYVPMPISQSLCMYLPSYIQQYSESEWLETSHGRKHKMRECTEAEMGPELQFLCFTAQFHRPMQLKEKNLPR